MLIAGGRVFGLDYYVMPALKNWWKGLPLVRKLYIYNDSNQNMFRNFEDAYEVCER